MHQRQAMPRKGVHTIIVAHYASLLTIYIFYTNSYKHNLEEMCQFEISIYMENNLTFRISDACFVSIYSITSYS